MEMNLAWVEARHNHTYRLEPKIMPIKCWKRIIWSLRNQVDHVIGTIVLMIMPKYLELCTKVWIMTMCIYISGI